MAVAVDQQSHGFKSFGRPPRCRLQSYSHLECTMPQLSQTTNNNFSDSSKQALFEAPNNNNNNIHRSSSTPCLPLATSMEEEYFHCNPRIEITGGNGDPRTRALVVEVAIALASGAVPVPVSTGLSGAYFLRGRNNNTIAVVKPIAEEPLAFSNPKGFTGMNIRAGETGLRELAAYLLDHGGFSGVPPTALVKISHVAFHVNHSETESQPPPPPPYKFASLQRFVEHDFDAGDLGPSGFSVSSIHSIGILDVRLLNLDRHAGNMLVKQWRENYAVGAAELVPIDHGLCLPESLDDPYFEWLHWPQASVPFTKSESEYIRNLNPLKDAELLRIKVPSIRESSIRVLVLCSVFLQRAAAAGLCLADIGEMMTREFCGDDNLSELERLCLNAKTVMSSLSNESFNNCNQSEEEVRDQESEMFQFDNEGDRRDDFGTSQGSDLPPELLSQGSSALGKPPRIPRVSTAASVTRLFDSPNNDIHNDDDNISFNSNDDNDSSGSGGYGGGGRGSGGRLIRGMTFSESNNYHKHESGGGRIILAEMSEEEWELFLESFEKLLPEAFEGTKCVTKKKKKQRLGTSWEL